MMRPALIALLLLGATFATISGMGLSGTLDSSGTASIAAEAEFTGLAGRIACLNISGAADSVTVRDRSGLIITHESRTDGNSTAICATVPVDYLEFSILSSSLTAKSGSLWDFDLALGASENITAFNATLSLPAGATLKGTNGAVMSGDDSLLIAWSASNIDTAHRARMRASYELPRQEAAAPDYILMAGAGALLLIMLALYSFALSPLVRRARALPAAPLQPPDKGAEALERTGTPPPSPAIESNPVFRTLDETDKEIVRELLRQGGKSTQAHLYLHTHVPKATLSRRIASLTNKGIIVKSRKGSRNLVSLTDVLKQ